jgi:hypothetical protein
MAETKLNYAVTIEGNAALMIIDKIAECRKRNISISQGRATQLLLCELYNIKQTGLEIKPCD